MGKLKCQSTKGIGKYLLTLSAIFTNLQKAEHPYWDEQKRLTLMNSLPNHEDWKQMSFKIMHDFTYYEQCRVTMKLEAERLRDHAIEKSQITAIIDQAKPKVKYGNGAKMKEMPKSNGPRNEGPLRKRRPVIPWSPIKGVRPNRSVITAKSLVISRVTGCRKKSTLL